jgi:hypothetical protein
VTRFIGWPEQTEDVAKQSTEAQHLGSLGAIGDHHVAHVDAIETLEEPAHRGPRGRPTRVVGHDFVYQFAHAPLGEPLDQQAEYHEDSARK